MFLLNLTVNKHYYYLSTIKYLLCIVLAIIYNCYISVEGKCCDQYLRDKENDPQKLN